MSKRFGTDKGLHDWRGKPLVCWVLSAVPDQAFPVVVVARDDDQAARYQRVLGGGVVVLRDAAPKGTTEPLAAPIVGAYSAFRFARKRAERVLILSCDLPCLKPELVDRLVELSEGHDLVVPRWENGYLEPLCAVYDPRVGLTAFKEAILGGDYKLASTFARFKDPLFVSVERDLSRFDHRLVSFKNVNKVEDLESAC